MQYIQASSGSRGAPRRSDKAATLRKTCSLNLAHSAEASNAAHKYNLGQSRTRNPEKRGLLLMGRCRSEGTAFHSSYRSALCADIQNRRLLAKFGVKFGDRNYDSPDAQLSLAYSGLPLPAPSASTQAKVRSKQLI